MDTLTQFLAIATQTGLDTIILTDHDTTTGWGEVAVAAADTDVSLIRGAEMSCSSSGITVRLLAYPFDPAGLGLTGNFRRTCEDREAHAARMAEDLSADYPITLDDVLAFTSEGDPVGCPHIVDMLVAAGAFPNRSAAFVQALHPSGLYYVYYWAPDPVGAVRCARKVRGMPVLAYPRVRKHQCLLPEAIIADMAEAGLSGIERDHRDRVPEDRADVKCMVRETGLAMSGSPDYHRTGKPNRIGENMMDPQVITEVITQGIIKIVES